MTTELALNARQRAMLAEIGVRVWLPTSSYQLKPVNLPEAVVAMAAVAVPVRREAPLRLPVMNAPPAQALGTTRYVIGNLPTDSAPYDLVVLGEPCQGTAATLLANMLKVLAPTAPRIFIAHMVVSHNDSISLQDQISTVSTKLILALGPHAAKALLRGAVDGIPFSKQRGVVHGFGDDTSAADRCVVTYHPQQLQRQALAKASSWQDLRLALKTLRQS